MKWWNTEFSQGDIVTFVPDAEVISEMSRKNRRNRDLQEVIRAFMNKPLQPGDVVEADDDLAMSEYNGKNVTVQSAITIEQVKKALAGQKDSAEFCFKYGGYEPVKKQDVTLTMPTFVNDVPDEIKAQLEEEAKALALLDGEEDADDDNDEEADE